MPSSQMRMYAVLTAFVFPIGVPLAIFIMLWRIRDKLNPSMRDGEDEMSIIDRLANSDLYKMEPIAEFSRQLRPQFW